jgi:hypothetical protein
MSHEEMGTMQAIDRTDLPVAIEGEGSTSGPNA